LDDHPCKNDTIATVLLPATKKTRLSELKTGFLEALKGTKTSPSNGTLEDSTCFQIFRASKIAGNLTDGGSTGSGGRPVGSWDALADEHATMSDLSVEEAETLGIGFRNSKGHSHIPLFPTHLLIILALTVFFFMGDMLIGSYDKPVIEIWREQETQ
jgi:hypothetical protein